MKVLKVFGEKPKFGQETYYCPYCSRTNLLYLWKNGRLIGIGLSKYVFCPKCENSFKIGLGFVKVELTVDVKR